MSPILTLGGFTVGNPLNAADYIGATGGTGAALQAAIDACPRGGSVYVPSEFGPWIPPDANGWIITDAIEIFSDGKRTPEDKGFWPYGAPNGHNSRVFNLVGTVGVSQSLGFRIHDCVFSGNTAPPAVSGTGDYIYCAAGYVHILIERCEMFYAGRSAVYLDGTSSPIVSITLRDSTMYGCGGHGIYMTQCHLIDIGGCIISTNHGMGTLINDSGDGVFIHNCDFSSNGDRLTNVTTATFPGSLSINLNAQLNMGGVVDGHVTACNFEDWNTSNQTYIKRAIVLRGCNAITIASCEFDTGSSLVDTSSITLTNGTICCAILPNFHSRVDRLVDIASATFDYSNVVFPQFTNITDATSVGRIVVPAGGRNLVFLNNRPGGQTDNKLIGVLLPEMTATADIDATVIQDGLLYFDTNSNKLCIVTGGVGTAVH